VTVIILVDLLAPPLMWIGQIDMIEIECARDPEEGLVNRIHVGEVVGTSSDDMQKLR
jgi:hypothetical protein